jgi:uncharacterized protein YecE (DUF72 family)
MRCIWIGTSGWVYKQWAGNFYPKGWPRKDELSYYVRHFPTVEINATFYRLPSLLMVRGWHDRSPPGFLFAIKGSRFLTHLKRLKETGPGLKKYFSRLGPLGDRAGPVLWQLAPNFEKTEETFARLERFLKKLPPRYRHAIEFRHPSWMDGETFALLRTHRAGNVWISSLRMPQDFTVTADFVYLRFHGLRDGAYHDYTTDELAPWAKQLRLAARRGLPCYVYFNNDLNTRAPLNAEALMAMLGQHAVPPLAKQATRVLDIPQPERGPETWPSWGRTSVRSSTMSARSRNTPPVRRRARTRMRPRPETAVTS